MNIAFTILGLLILGGVAYYFHMREKALRMQLDRTVAEKFAAEKQLEVERQKAMSSDLRMKDWETQREESIKSAKAAIFEVGGQLSSKLLEDHKREQEITQKEQEARLAKTTQNLMEQMTSVAQTIATLREQTITTQTKADTLWRAISSPTTAGQLAEIGLENTLKNLGLEAGRDFIMQYAVSDRESGLRLRPDAIVFLPQEMVIVVDSKASKFLLELAQAENDDQKTTALDRLKRTMNQHVKDLSSKDYGNFVQARQKETGRGADVRFILNVMYVPSEAAVEHLKQADTDIMEKLEKANIILAGPASLHGLFSLAHIQISEAKQAENARKIIVSIENLMESVVSLFAHTDKIGRGIESAAKAFNELANSANRRLLPRMKTIEKMGVSAKGKPLPAPIMTYDLRRMDDALTIDLEPDDASSLLEDKTEAA